MNIVIVVIYFHHTLNNLFLFKVPILATDYQPGIFCNILHELNGSEIIRCKVANRTRICPDYHKPDTGTDFLSVPCVGRAFQKIGIISG